MTENRRARLRLWFSDKSIPPKEKSYLSQLMKGKAPFGEKAARRLETDYRMGGGYLDAPTGQQDLSFFSAGKGSELLPSPDTTPALLLAYSRPTNEEIEIRQFDTGGSMGAGVLLRDQPGVIQSWRVSPEWLDKNVRSHTGAENLCIVTGFGDSMRGMFEPGDPLIVDTGVRAVEFDAIYFFRVDGEGFIKRLQRIPGEGIRAISENKAYESWTIKSDMDFEVFGRVLKAWKSEDY